MDIPSVAWLSQLEMEEPCDFMNQHQQKCHYGDSLDSFSSERLKGYPNIFVPRNQSIQATSINADQGKQQEYKATMSTPFTPSYGSSSKTFTISFRNLNSSPENNPYQLNRESKLKYPYIVKPKEEMSLNEFLGSTKVFERVTRTSRNHRQAQEHLLSERKRREKLAQRFSSLAALLPELNKMDKATVLEDASKYIIQLQTRVKELEERLVKGKHTIQESIVSIRGSKFSSHEDYACSSDETHSLPSSSAYNPEIKVKISRSNILVRIYCTRDSSLLLKTLIEMERLCITVISSSVVPFSNTDLLITIIGQKNDEFTMTAMDLVKCLQSTLRSVP